MIRAIHSELGKSILATVAGLTVSACGGASEIGGNESSSNALAGTAGTSKRPAYSGGTTAPTGTANVGGSAKSGSNFAATTRSAGGTTNGSAGSILTGGFLSTGGQSFNGNVGSGGLVSSYGGALGTVGGASNSNIGGSSNRGGALNSGGTLEFGGTTGHGGTFAGTTVGGFVATTSATNAGGSPATCGADGGPCTLSGGILGLCQNNSCKACAGAQANLACSAAYGAGAGYVCAQGACVPGNCVTTADCGGGTLCGVSAANTCGTCQSDDQCRGTNAYGSGYLCANGSCILGNCKADADCGTGKICGLQLPNNCAGCVADSQCQGNPTYGPTTICNTANGTCVAAACTQASTACSANALDFCCGNTCTAGNCCSAADCAKLGNNYTCTNHTCTHCAQATGNTYYVDPQNGNDTSGTGNNATAGCAFRTISRALSFIGSAPNPGTVVAILPTTPVAASTGETFPIRVPTNTTITGSGAVATIQVPSANVGFVLSQANSGLVFLVVDGQSHTANYGIQVTGGSSAISNVTVTNMLRDGIRVTNAAVLTIGQGVSATNNGTTTTAADGLRVTNSGRVILSVPSGTPSRFDGNSAHGILVDGTASINLTGAAATNGQGTITTNSNTLAGLWIQQTPGASLPLNDVNGLVAWANRGNGIRIVAGSAVRLRNSYVLANAGNAVLVSTNTTSSPQSNDTTRLDLGTPDGPDYGRNTLQASLGNNPNGNAGICLQLSRNASSTLNAAGNLFAGAVDCASSTSSLKRSNTCNGQVDVAVSGNANTTNSIVVSQCK